MSNPLFFALAVAGVGLVFADSANSAQALELKTDPVSGRKFTSWADGRLAAKEGVRLKLTKFEKKYAGEDYSYIDTCGSSVPDVVSDNDSAGFCYASLHDDVDFKHFDTGFYFYYDIQVPDSLGEWKPSGYYVDAAAKVPMFGDTKIDCTIKLSGSTVPAEGAPFRCEASAKQDGAFSNKAALRWTITANPVKVIDAAVSSNVDLAAKLIGDNCKVFDTPRCNWTRTQKSSAFLQSDDDWLPLTDWDDSCPPTDPTRLTVVSATRNVQLSWSDKVGGKIAGKLGFDAFGAKVETSVEVNYEHSITQSDSYGEGHQYTIPYNYRSALYLQHGLLQVTGDFSIIAGGNRYLIKNAVFQFPLQKDVRMEGGAQPVRRGVVQHVNVPCSQKKPDPGSPPPKGALASPLPRG